MSNFSEWVWTKACNAWAEIASWVDFYDIKSAYISGYHAGYQQALKDIEKEGGVDDPVSTQE